MSDEPLDYLTTEDLLEIAAGVVGDVTVRDEGLLLPRLGVPGPARSAMTPTRCSPRRRRR